MKICISCNKDFDGRTNKQFCSTKCKNQFHNQRNAEENKVLSKVNYQLKKNRAVLKELHEKYKASFIPMEFLDLKDYNSLFHTHVTKSKAGDTFVFCYDYGWRQVKSRSFQIIKSEQFV